MERLAVIVPDPRRMQRVKAFIVPAEGVEANEALKERILEKMREQIQNVE